MPIRRKLTIATLLIAVSAGGVLFMQEKQSLSGTYIELSEAEVGMLQLVQTQDTKLSGQYQLIMLKDDGSIEDVAASVSGDTDGKSISLTLTFPIVPTKEFSLAASGHRDGNEITLTAGAFGEAPETSVFIKSDLQSFQLASEALRKKSELLLAKQEAQIAYEKAKKQQKNFVSTTNALVTEIKKVTGKIEEILSRPRFSETKYSDITSQLKKHLQEAYKKPGYENGLARQRIILEMQQGIISTQAVYQHVQSIQRDYDTIVSNYKKPLELVQSACLGFAERNITLPSCTALLNAVKPYSANMSKLKGELERLEKLYQAEYTMQQNLIAEAGNIQ